MGQYLAPTLPKCWSSVLEPAFNSKSYQDLREFLRSRYDDAQVFPKPLTIFRALKETKFDDVKVVILGKEPYFGRGQANGLAFGVNTLPAPPALKNIKSELIFDLDIESRKAPRQTTLEGWSKQGVLLLNSVLTVEEGSPGSHWNKGWENLTDEIIQLLSKKKEGLVFILWGTEIKHKLIDPRKHAIIKSAHPDPKTAATGFFGSRPFTTANSFLKRFNKKPIDWLKIDNNQEKQEFDSFMNLITGD